MNSLETVPIIVLMLVCTVVLVTLLLSFLLSIDREREKLDVEVPLPKTSKRPLKVHLTSYREGTRCGRKIVVGRTILTHRELLVTCKSCQKHIEEGTWPKE